MTEGKAEVYEDDTQTAKAQYPTPAWQTMGKDLSWVEGCNPFPQPIETKQRGFWTAGTYLSGC